MESSRSLEQSHRGGWPWLLLFCALGLFWLIRGVAAGDSPHVLLGLACPLLGIFAFYNKPTSLMQRPAALLTVAHKVSYLCGFVGVVLAVSSAVVRWW